MSEGADTLDTDVGKENDNEEMDTIMSERTDTFNTDVGGKSKDYRTKKQKKAEWMKLIRIPTKIEERKMFGKAL